MATETELKKNQIHTVRIEGYADGGAGVARIGGRVVFVAGALRGETCRALILKVNKRVAYAKAVEILTPSAHRLTPDCPYFPRCGGCTYRHMEYAEEMQLKRRRVAENNRAQSGLELDVVDHNNGTERSVKTLSGGESFKASLSLALGLSDEIQSSAGGIRLDTMFVDEGFGSLDEESLQQAMRALSGLTENNRLVGIISHVAELKEKIDRQIVVTKEKSGGSRVEIVV